MLNDVDWHPLVVRIHRVYVHAAYKPFVSCIQYNVEQITILYIYRNYSKL